MTKKKLSGKGRRLKSSREQPSPPRKGSSKTIGALLPTVTKPAFQRKSPLFIRLILDWESIVGPNMAQQSEPCRLRPGVLTIRCSGPMAMEIQYAIPRLLERINTACGLFGEHALQQIKLVQDRTITPAPVKKKSAPVQAASVPDMEEGPLREALERLGGHVAARLRKK